MKKLIILAGIFSLLFASCKTSSISLPQGTSESAALTQDEPVEPAKNDVAEKNDDWLTTDADFAVPDPKEPEEIAAYDEVHGESAEEKAAREEKEAKELLEKQEAARIEAERIASQKAKEDADRKTKQENEKKAEAERREAERVAAQKLEAERKVKAEEEKRIRAEQREAERIAAKKAEDERKEKAAAARKAEAERREAERAAAKKAEEERKAREKAEAAERVAREKEAKEAERKAKAAKEAEKKAEEERILAEAAARREALERQAAIDAARVTPAIEDAPYEVETLDKTPSRSVRVLVNQYVDVAYPGAGWVYLGEVDESQNLISFANRDLDNSDTCFTLRAIQSGTAVLHFYKQDVLTGTYIDDFLEVVVLPQQYKGNEHQVAPLYSEIVPPNQRKYTARRQNNGQQNVSSSSNAGSVKNDAAMIEEDTYEELPQLTETNIAETNAQADRTVNRTIQINESAPEVKPSKKDAAAETAAALPANIADYTSAQLLAAAQKAFDEKKYDDSLSYVNLFFEKATTQLDEGWFLKGQLYESPKASFRNIRTSRDCYQALIDRYPSSALWKKANNRIMYIDRYYFKIR